MESRENFLERSCQIHKESWREMIIAARSWDIWWRKRLYLSAKVRGGDRKNRGDIFCLTTKKVVLVMKVLVIFWKGLIRLLLTDLKQEPLNTWTGRLLGIFVTFSPLRISRNDNNITCAAVKKKWFSRFWEVWLQI